MCPVVHNISGQLVMDRPINPSFVQGSGNVSRRHNFGNTRSLYTVTGNILFRPGHTDMVFKGVRSIPAMNQMLQRATQGGELMAIRVSMVVMTIQLHTPFAVCEQCPLERALVRACGSDIQMLPRTEEESNALIFRVTGWAAFLSGDPELIAKMGSIGSIISMSRMGNCTLRASSSVRGDIADWLDTQQCVQRALSKFAHFVLALDQTVIRRLG
jgi:hypothetical protein